MCSAFCIGVFVKVLLGLCFLLGSDFCTGVFYWVSVIYPTGTQISGLRFVETRVYLSTLQKWTDEYLQWNISDYEGLNEIVVKANQVWLPDLGITNR